MTDNESILRVASFPTTVAAHTYANALAATGINASVVGDHTSEFRVGANGFVEVFVSETRFDEAKAILEELNHAADSRKRRDCGSDAMIEKGWKRMLVWMIIGINVAGVISYAVISFLNR